MGAEDAAVYISVRWVPDGVSKRVPDANVLLDDGELRRVRRELEAEARKKRNEKKKKKDAKDDEEAAGDDVDMEEEGTTAEEEEMEHGEENTPMFSDMRGDIEATLADPYLRTQDVVESDGEDNEIDDNDHPLLAVRTADDENSIEFLLYREDEDGCHLGLHHQIEVPCPPLCIEWLRTAASTVEGNFCAVGYLESPHIDIWNLDVMEVFDPVMTLGSTSSLSDKRSRKKTGSSSDLGHTKPVICLDDHRKHREFLVSGSADTTIRVWDIQAGSSLHTFRHHEKPVQVCKWHPTEGAIILSASFDKKLCVIDARNPDSLRTAQLTDEAECAIWYKHNPWICFASSQDGTVAAWDVRKFDGNMPLWSLKAHDRETTGVTDTSVPNMLVTCSYDETAKVWNIADGKPTLVHEKRMAGGKLHAVDAHPDHKNLVALCGVQPIIWDLTSEQSIVDAFKLES